MDKLIHSSQQENTTHFSQKSTDKIENNLGTEDFNPTFKFNLQNTHYVKNNTFFFSTFTHKKVILYQVVRKYQQYSKT